MSSHETTIALTPSVETQVLEAKGIGREQITTFVMESILADCAAETCCPIVSRSATHPRLPDVTPSTPDTSKGKIIYGAVCKAEDCPHPQKPGDILVAVVLKSSE